jgi:hypothetical protein
VPEFAKDVVLALLGGSIGLAGLLLVVAGFVLSQASGFPATTPDALLKRYEVAAKLGLVPFGLALAEAALCLVWAGHATAGVYQATVWMFFVLLAATAAYGFVLLLKYL